jgi:hypothetical protein
MEGRITKPPIIVVATTIMMMMMISHQMRHNGSLLRKGAPELLLRLMSCIQSRPTHRPIGNNHPPVCLAAILCARYCRHV